MKGKINIFLVLGLSFVMSLGCFAGAKNRVAGVSFSRSASLILREEDLRLPASGVEQQTFGQTSDTQTEPDENERVSAIITLDGEAVLDFFSQYPSYDSPAEFMDSSDGRSALEGILSLQSQMKRKILAACPQAEFGYTYNVAFSGFSVTVPYSGLAKIQAVPGVLSAQVDTLYGAPDENAEEEMYEQLESALSGEIISSASAPRTQDNSLADAFDGLASSITVGASSISLYDDGTYNTSGLTYGGQGMQGQGMLISVIDTGINLSHEAFAVAPQSPKYGDSGYLTGKTSKLKARKGTYSAAEPSAYELFKSLKIPFGFDYADNDSDPSLGTTSGDHGLHVAGIAAGNNGSLNSNKVFRGTAPEAQLAVMKVFKNTENGARDNVIIAAIEDSIVIGADVINISLGAPAGFSGDSAMDTVIAKALNAGVTLAIAAGNNYNSAYQSNPGAPYAANPDFGTVGSSSSYNGGLCIANFLKDGSNYSSSTSWGPGPDLSLKPEIASAGNAIQSAVAGSNNSFGNKTGTSMATPNVAGVTAVLKQRLKAGNYFPSDNAARGRMADQILMSTAYPVVHAGSGAYYSPRVQGAGFADPYNAVNAKAYLYVNENQNTAKLELKDDPKKTGVYTMKFYVKNIDSAARVYNLSAAVQTESFNASGLITLMPYKLAGGSTEYSVTGADCSVSGTRLTVGANRTATLTVKHTLAAGEKTYLNSFKNGIYVDGFVLLKSVSDSLNLNIPFLGFYGDWTKTPVFDYTVYDGLTSQAKVDNQGLYAKYNGADEVLMGAYESNDYTSTYRNSLTDEQKARLEPSKDYLAAGLYTTTGGKIEITKFQTALMRNARNLHYTFSDPVTGQVFYTSGKSDVRKSYLNSSSSPAWDRTIETGLRPADFNGGGGIKNNTILNLSYNASVDYGNYSTAVHQSQVFPIFIDYEKPKLVTAAKMTDEGKTYVDITTFDNHYARTIKLYYNTAGEGLKPMQGQNRGTPVVAYNTSSNVTTRIELTTGYIGLINNSSSDRKLWIEIEDFARNKARFSIENITTSDALSLGIWESSKTSAQTATELQNNEALNAQQNSPAFNGQEDSLTGDMTENGIFATGDVTTQGGITYVELPDGNFSVRKYTDASNRPSIAIKEGTVRIEPGAFENCVYLKTVKLPSTLLRIGEGAFKNCSKLTTYQFEGKKAPLLEISYSSFTPSNEHPYNHFNAFIEDVTLQMTLKIRYGSLGYDNWVFGAFFIARDIDCTIIFVTGGPEVAPLFGDRDDIVNSLPEPVLEGFSFEGWYLDEEFTKPYDAGRKFENITLYAKWSRESFSVSFDTGGGEIIGEAPQRVQGGGQFTVPDAKMEGHTLKCWIDVSQNEYLPGDTVTVNVDINIAARWIVNSYTITFESRGGTEQTPYIVNYGEEVESPEKPEKTGHVFMGWYEDEQCTRLYEFNTMPSRNLTLYAGWELAQYKIEFETNCCEEISDINVAYGEEVDLPVPHRYGYDFAGWYEDEDLTVKYTAGVMPAGGFKLFAAWEPATFTISFETLGGSICEAISQKYDTELNAPDSPCKEGHTFSGWYMDADYAKPFVFTAMPGKDITLYAKWEINSYTLTFAGIEGADLQQQSYAYGEDISGLSRLFEPQRTGYTFAGWYLDTGCTEPCEYETMPAKDLTLYAKWTVNMYTVTLDLNGGTGIGTVQCEFGGDLSILPIPEKTGCIFAGWYIDQGLTVPNVLSAMPAQDIILYAAWIKRVFKIDFILGDGEGDESVQYTYGDDISGLDTFFEPQRVGHTFAGWYLDAECSEPCLYQTMPEGGFTLYAKWEINIYTITLELNGGSGAQSVSGQFGTNADRPQDPVKEGYTFEGWYSDEACTIAFEFDVFNKYFTVYAAWMKNTEQPADPGGPDDTDDPNNPDNPEDTDNPDGADDPGDSDKIQLCGGCGTVVSPGMFTGGALVILAAGLMFILIKRPLKRKSGRGCADKTI